MARAISSGPCDTRNRRTDGREIPPWSDAGPPRPVKCSLVATGGLAQRWEATIKDREEDGARSLGAGIPPAPKGRHQYSGSGYVLRAASHEQVEEEEEVGGVDQAIGHAIPWVVGITASRNISDRQVS